MTDRMTGEGDQIAEETDRSHWTPAEYQAEIDRLLDEAGAADKEANRLKDEQRRLYPGPMSDVQPRDN